ncbi:hypothetical protein [Luteolibacter rhizosphaerae]|uniref:hypothetical protein n=1 Tax=Luteolibacter rhizosphaerae TaxID=2989719 RepID=UPI00222212EA|nr:hypothetical protein [Luteolibacter rhizosphaerae]
MALLPLVSRVPLFLCLATVPARAATPTPQQVATALHAPSGTDWSADSFESAVWDIQPSQLRVRGIPAGTTTLIEARVTGPGVVGLGWIAEPGLFRTSVTIDGVQSGATTQTGYDPPRAEVGPGEHFVRWEAYREYLPINGDPYLLAFGNATWEPYTPLPLNEAAAGAGVSLSSDGENAWIGRDGISRVDGKAAWSHLKVDRSQTSEPFLGPPLRANFQGPGILSYSYLRRGNGLASFRLNGGAWQALDMDQWNRNLLPVPAGSHLAEWNGGPASGLTGRGSFDMAVDEVEILPELAIAEALKTPGLTWAKHEQSGKLPFGVAGPGGSNDSLVVLPENSAISTTVEGGSLLVVEHRSSLQLHVDGQERDWTGVPDGLTPNGMTGTYLLPPGQHSLRLSATGYPSRIHRLRLISPPADIAAAFPLPAGVVASGGPAPWQIVASPSTGTYAVRTNLTGTAPTASLRFPVNGPAKVVIGVNGTSFANFSITMDGLPLTVAETYLQYGKMILEVPAGQHLIEGVAKRFTGGEDGVVEVSRISIEPLAEPGDWLPATETNLPVLLTTGLWRTVTGMPDTEGNTTLLSDEDTGTVETAFEGPGFLDFRWFNDRTVHNSSFPPGFHMQSATNAGLYLVRWTSDESGWKSERVWFPPGLHRVKWSFAINGNQENPRFALDKIRFTPVLDVDLTEALDDPYLIWHSGPELPWVGTSREATDDFAVSPQLAAGEESRLATSVYGPGRIVFNWATYGGGSGDSIQFLVNGVPRDLVFVSPDQVSIEIPEPGPALLEWVVSSLGGTMLRIHLDQVRWTSYSPDRLNEALDSLPGVRWTTSAATPFTFNLDPGAHGGSSAGAAVPLGGEAWLEATVDGPGSFDFWLRPLAGHEVPSNPWDFWELSIDGVPVVISGLTWNEQWITGSGPHKIRLTLRNPQGSGLDFAGGAVDLVTWNPAPALPLTQAAGLPKQKWKTDSRNPATGLGSGGRDGAPALLMRTLPNRSSWTQTVVKGPCLLSWDSHLRFNSDAGDSQVSLFVDGSRVLRLGEHEWQRMRLTLPAGSHTLRWVTEPWDEEQPPPAAGDPQAFDAVWRLSGMTLVKGITPLSDALDAPGIFALEIGDEGGSLVMEGGQDAWALGLHAQLYFFSPAKTGPLSLRWGRPDFPSGGLLHSDHEGTSEIYSNPEPGWTEAIAMLAPGGYSRWAYDPESGETAPYLDGALTPNLKPRTLAQAIEAKAAVTGYGWLGFDSSQAKVGKDLAWSLLKYTNQENIALTTLKGPARVSFCWKKSGEGQLSLSVDGSVLPLPAPTGEWSQVEFDINAGEHALVWSHSIGTYEPHPQAWIDGLKSRKIPATSLAQAAAPAGGLELASDNPISGQVPWHPVALLDSDGRWTRAARVASGRKTLSTTITGPAMLKLSARCFDDFAGSDHASASSRVIITVPGDRVTRMSQHLSISVGAQEKARVDASTKGAWQEVAVRIPAGTHEVSFRLMEVNRSFFADAVADATNTGLQGWVTALQVESPENHYAAWEASHGLPAGSGDLDSDGDGSSNRMEYRFGTDPLSAGSMPPSLQILPNPWIRNDPRLLLRVPFLPMHSTGILETSRDLTHWEVSPEALRAYPRGSSFFFAPVDTPTHQGVELPAEDRRYYRLRFED